MKNDVLVMEVSLDFEENKITHTGPKAKQKSKGNKVKPRKGQGNIKTFFKKKKSDLVKYTKDFDKVCQKNGIDVDTYELQLAIAVSKSLQPTDEIEAENLTTTKFLSPQERTERIRRTLQEYGFKVSSKNIKPLANRKGKTHRKLYKLLSVTEEEKHQKINDRYTQILFENPCNIIENKFHCTVEKGLYYLATNLSYESMKRCETFYVSEILSEISNVKSNFLKNWADIPGRPSSPIEREDYTVSISDIECTQAELDIMLSGTLKAAKDICKVKMKNYSKFTNDGNQSADNLVLNTESSSVSSESMVPTTKQTTISANRSYHSEMLLLYQSSRCQSPDIFGEEDTTIIDDSDKNISLPENCVNIHLDSSVCGNSIIDQCTLQCPENLTKRRTNDFMDLTECVPVNVQIHEDKLKSNLETVNECQSMHNNMEITECINNISFKINPDACDLIDLTQQVDNSLDSTKKSVSVKNNFSMLDLTQSSDSEDDLPAVKICGSQEIASEDTVVVNYDDYFDTVLTQKSVNSISNEENTSQHFIEEALEDNLCESDNVNIEDNEHRVSGRSSLSYNSMTHIIKTNNHDEKDEMSNIDLTQSSDSRSEVNSQNSDKEYMNNTQSIDYNSLGKKNNVSIDYDDILEDAATNMCSSDKKFDDIYYGDANNSETVHIDEDNDKNDVLNCSNTSECFSLSDPELNYSIAKSTAEIFDVNNTLNTEKFQDMNNTKSLNESYLPFVGLTGNKGLNDVQQQTETYITLNKSTRMTPVRAIIREDKISIQTPTNSEYVVKTGNITPMLDYEAMSSPERNRELEKYGLKPFKRKRAIQLLTHLYNQTHPIIEYCSEEPVLAKKFKPNSHNIPSTIIENVEKEEDVQLVDMDKENMFRQTKDVPDIRDIECSDEDWVFQKTEKAKILTCRVPLHIAFHNYVSCRRALREAILQYKPINIDVIHKDLVSYGYKYNPKDLLKFLDKKCITVKTADNNGRNNKK